MTASFTFTADSGSDQLTIVGHGQVTGNGPADVRNVGGALPGSLSPLTDYWLIRIDDDTLQLALSSSDALDGTAINLASDGSGTNYLEIGVPYRRPRTYANGSQLPPADLNDNFDAWKALYALLTGQSQSMWPTGPTLSGASGALTIGGVISLTGTITPAAISGAVQDYAPAGLSTANTLRIASTLGSDSIGGLTGGADGRVVVLSNVGSTAWALVHADAGSTANNQFALPNNTDITIRPNGGVTLRYDGTSSRWRAIGLAA